MYELVLAGMFALLALPGLVHAATIASRPQSNSDDFLSHNLKAVSISPTGAPANTGAIPGRQSGQCDLYPRADPDQRQINRK